MSSFEILVTCNLAIRRSEIRIPGIIMLLAATDLKAFAITRFNLSMIVIQFSIFLALHALHQHLFTG